MPERPKPCASPRLYTMPSMGEASLEMVQTLVQQVQAGQDTLRTEMQQGFAALREEQAHTTEKLEAMAQTLVGVQCDIRSLQREVTTLGVAVDGHTHRLDRIEKRLKHGARREL